MEQAIIEFLKSKAIGAWEHQAPYLLSFAGPDLSDQGIDYRAMLDGERLIGFVERTSGEGGYKVVRHPRQRAKLGIVPFDADFHFDDLGQELPDPSGATQGPEHHGSALLDFLKALSKLPPDDLDGIVIPTRVLVKLAKKR